MWELRREHTVNSKCKNNYLERENIAWEYVAVSDQRNYLWNQEYDIT